MNIKVLEMSCCSGGKLQAITEETIKELLNIKFGRKKSIRYMDILSILDTIILSIIGVMITMLNNNIAIIIIILYIWILVLKEHKITRQKVVMYKSLEKFTYWNLACKYSRDVNTNIPQINYNNHCIKN